MLLKSLINKDVLFNELKQEAFAQKSDLVAFWKVFRIFGSHHLTKRQSWRILQLFEADRKLEIVIAKGVRIFDMDLSNLQTED